MDELVKFLRNLTGRFHRKDIEIVELRGIKIPMDGSIISPEVGKHIFNGEYEAREASRIEQIIVEGERVLELGAGIGFLSCLILKSPKVEAYLGVEAHPKLPEFIQKVFKLNGVKGDILNAVVTNDPDRDFVDFYVRKDFWISSSLPELASQNIRSRLNREKSIKLKSVSLDELIKQFRPSLIVCDIEGGESSLFTGVDLECVSKIYLELHEDVIGQEGIIKLHTILAEQGLLPVQTKTPQDVVLFRR